MSSLRAARGYRQPVRPFIALRRALLASLSVSGFGYHKSYFCQKHRITARIVEPLSSRGTVKQAPTTVSPLPLRRALLTATCQGGKVSGKRRERIREKILHTSDPLELDLHLLSSALDLGAVLLAPKLGKVSLEAKKVAGRREEGEGMFDCTPSHWGI
jgi:hypothetical protein